MKDKTPFIVGAAGFLVFLALLAVMAYRSDRGPAPGQPQQAQQPQQAKVDASRLVRMHSPALGRNDAPVVIVEFLDPACETCRTFYPLVKDLMAANPDKIRLVLRYAPFHKGSDKVIALLEAARAQGKFWPALEALLAAQKDWVVRHVADVDRAWPHLEGLGLDLARLRKDAAAPGVAAVIKQDLEDAVALEVAKTPEFFVNGRPLPRFGYDELKGLVREALAATAR